MVMWNKYNQNNSKFEQLQSSPVFIKTYGINGHCNIVLILLQRIESREMEYRKTRKLKQKIYILLATDALWFAYV